MNLPRAFNFFTHTHTHTHTNLSSQLYEDAQNKLLVPQFVNSKLLCKLN